MRNKQKLFRIVFWLIAVILAGTLGYILLLRVDFIDALYMTIITISTVGFGEVGPMTDAAKLFTIFLIFAGLFVVGYGVTGLISMIFEGKLKTAWRKRRMEAKMQELKGHYIVCGAGEVGRTVIKSLNEDAVPFIVIEENEKRADELTEAGILTIRGNATNEEILQKAGISQAKGIVCTLPTDSENVFAVLTARQMNEDIYIVSKAVERTSHNKLRKAGANTTISPNEIGGQRMAAHLIRPSVISFLDVITRAGDVTLDLEEVIICACSGTIGKSLSEVKIPEQTGLIILALKRKDETEFKFNPGSGEILKEGDTLVTLGTAEQVAHLNAIINPA